ncbi:MAG TPA: hypothetical protein VMV52_04705 [Candidatus Nanopelagicaceae bacterium]|nr:hypothetical protein [Candidatus Nanopelagicaceae bacterium]
MIASTGQELRFATVITREAVESDVVAAMTNLGWRVALRALDLQEVLLSAEQERIELVLVGGDRPDGQMIMTLMERGIRVIGVIDSALAKPRFQAYGVVNVVQYESQNPDRLVQDLAALFQLRQTNGHRNGDQLGHFFCVGSATGSPGRTSIALNLAMESADLGYSTLLTEIDRMGGALAQQLGLINTASTLTRALTSKLPIAQFAPAIAPNFHVLTAPLQPMMLGEVDPRNAEQLWQKARSEFEICIIDIGSVSDLFQFTPLKRRFERLVVDVLRQANEVFMVVGADPQSVARTLRSLDALTSELPDLHIRLIANKVPARLGRRQGARGDFSTEDLVRAFATHELDIHQIPLDLELFGRALNQGRALAEMAPRSNVRKAIRQLTEDVWPVKVA